MVVLMKNASKVPTDVTAHCCTDVYALCPAEYEVWGGEWEEVEEMQAGFLPLRWSFSHQNMGFGALRLL